MTALRLAVSFLTCVPSRADRWDSSRLGAALVFFPVVGLLLGAMLASVAWLLDGHLSSELIAVALVALLALLTGGLHLDGVSDVFDGLGAGRDRERALAIMRDSRVGAFGAAALLLVLLVKVAAIRDVLEAGAPLWLCGFPVVARLGAVALVVCFPYARVEGLGRAFHEQGRLRHFVLAALVATPVLVWLGERAMVASCAALAVALVAAAWLNRRLAGITGDVCGAAIELSEVTFLIACAWR